MEMTETLENCPRCKAPQITYVEQCSSCGASLGAPNVRLANTEEELQALEQKFSDCEEVAKRNSITEELYSLIVEVSKNSKVIISLPAPIALNLVNDPNMLFKNYETLVGTNSREPASFANDTHRKIVSGSLFGSFAEKIIYGALSLSNIGLKTYGDVYCTLKEISVNERTSFLITNSYEFLEQFGETGLPKGFRADWKNRGKLVAVKFLENDNLKKKQKTEDWAQILLFSDGVHREKDEFIEAHIFGKLNIYSVDKMLAAEPIDKKERALIDTIIETFKHL